MKTKAVAIVLTILAIVILAFEVFRVSQHQRSSDQVSESTGRYQLLQARFDLFVLAGPGTNNSPFKMEGLFKLDSATGKVWLYREAVADGNHRQIWQLIEQ